ncbi:unnamed protein product [Effrenium voratum]|uniref:Uncharacterized protein n=1 Tax=Effrenium voratum TaxID=2562239 RepID=A0AA36NHU2_9DINO|nr:unnamed protein product [Effrenium voratum]
MKRHGNPEMTTSDLESPSGNKVISMAPPNIQPYQAFGQQEEKKVHKRSASMDAESMKKVAAAVGGIWVLGILLGYEYLWPLQLLLELLGGLFAFPPLSWLGSTFSWVFSFANRGAPVVQQTGALQEMRLPSDQVHVFTDQYVHQYGDAALVFASHDGYPQIVNGLLYNRELAYADLIDATDENGNTALVYAAAKGFRQTTAALLRSGADPDAAGGGGRTPLMEAAGAGHKDIVAALRLSNSTVDAVDDYGNTALHYAAYHGHLSSVTELLKASPRKDIPNSYGHTAASYAASNRFKAIADLLNRAPSRRELAKAEAARKVEVEEDEDDLADLKELADRLKSEPKKVKGAAEDLHKRDDAFAPKLEQDEHLSDKEKHSLEEQVAKLKRRHEDAELKNQRRIVELLEASNGQQQALDEAQRAVRAYQLNFTELSFKVQELETKRQSSELRAADAKDRADRLHQEMQEAEIEVQRHKARAEAAEQEAKMHQEVVRRHEEGQQNRKDEVNNQQQQLEKQQQDLSALRGDVQKSEEALRQHRERAAELERQLAALRPVEAGVAGVAGHGIKVSLHPGCGDGSLTGSGALGDATNLPQAAMTMHPIHHGVQPEHVHMLDVLESDTAKPFIIPILGLIAGIVMMNLPRFVQMTHEATVATVGKLVLYFGAQSFMNIFMGWVFRTHVTLEKGYVLPNGNVLDQDLHGCPVGFALTAMQQVISFFCFIILYGALYYTPYRIETRKITSFNEVVSICIFGSVFALNIALNNFSLGYISIAVNLIIRSCLPLTTFLSQQLSPGR